MRPGKIRVDGDGAVVIGNSLVKPVQILQHIATVVQRLDIVRLQPDCLGETCQRFIKPHHVMKQYGPVVPDGWITGHKVYQPVTVRQRLVKQLHLQQGKRAIVQRTEVIRGCLERTPEIGYSGGKPASRLFHGSLVEMDLGMSGMKGQRAGEKITRPVTIAKLCRHDRQQMGGVKAIRREAEDLLITSGCRRNVPMFMQVHGFLQDTCNSIQVAGMRRPTRFDGHSWQGPLPRKRHTNPHKTLHSCSGMQGKHTSGRRFDKNVDSDRRRTSNPEVSRSAGPQVITPG